MCFFFYYVKIRLGDNMKFLVGSYKENIYEVLIDKENNKFVSKNIIYNV